jgi:AcrR family transcriptional regulator
MPRPTKEQIDDEILEAAAELFARHGFRETSVQRIADAVGYSKTGLLHRYPSKEALQQAVIDRALREVRQVSDHVGGRPPGTERDRAAIILMAGLALDCPGSVALVLAGLMSAPESEIGLVLQDIGQAVFAAFALDPEADPVRLVRVVGALGALAVTAVALRDKVPATALATIIDVSCDALGHRVPAAH